MDTEIGDLILNSRAKMSLTQDQFAKKYNITGPAIFKFEKSYVKPALRLWLEMAKDMKVSEKQAVLLWIRAKLPDKYQAYVTLRAAGVADKTVHFVED